MNQNPRASICIITYNQEKYIADAIEGALNQKTNFTYEIYIGDDASTDQTKVICQRYAEEHPDIIRFNQSTENVGMVKNWVNSILLCRGGYIAICEGDDYWTDPHKLQKQVDFLESNPDHGLVSSAVELIDENGESIPDNSMVLKQYEKRKTNVDFFDLLETNLINTLTVCVRADLMKQLADRIINKNLWFVYDQWFWLHIALKSKIRIFDEKMAAYRVHSGGVSKQKKFFQTRKPLLINIILMEALTCNHIDKGKIFKKYFSLIYSLIKSRNIETLLYIFKFKKLKI